MKEACAVEKKADDKYFSCKKCKFREKLTKKKKINSHLNKHYDEAIEEMKKLETAGTQEKADFLFESMDSISISLLKEALDRFSFFDSHTMWLVFGKLFRVYNKHFTEAERRSDSACTPLIAPLQEEFLTLLKIQQDPDSVKLKRPFKSRKHDMKNFKNKLEIGNCRIVLKKTPGFVPKAQCVWKTSTGVCRNEVSAKNKAGHHNYCDEHRKVAEEAIGGSLGLSEEKRTLFHKWLYCRLYPRLDELRCDYQRKAKSEKKKLKRAEYKIVLNILTKTQLMINLYRKFMNPAFEVIMMVLMAAIGALSSITIVAMIAFVVLSVVFGLVLALLGVMLVNYFPDRFFVYASGCGAIGAGLFFAGGTVVGAVAGGVAGGIFIACTAASAAVLAPFVVVGAVIVAVPMGIVGAGLGIAYAFRRRRNNEDRDAFLSVRDDDEMSDAFSYEVEISE